MRAPADLTVLDAEGLPTLAQGRLGAIADLIRETGPVSYDYQFGPHGILLREVVRHSWSVAGSLFAGDATNWR